LQEFGGLADHSGGPATDLHRFPYCPRDQIGAAEPVENSSVQLAAELAIVH
jgi:hypothetical protein